MRKLEFIRKIVPEEMNLDVFDDCDLSRLFKSGYFDMEGTNVKIINNEILVNTQNEFNNENNDHFQTFDSILRLLDSENPHQKIMGCDLLIKIFKKLEKHDTYEFFLSESLVDKKTASPEEAKID